MTGGRGVSRVVLAELADDGQVAPLARALRDAGLEVVYAGGLLTCEQVASTVEQEDPDVLVLAFDAGTDPALLAQVAASVVGVRLFGWGVAPGDALEKVFDDEAEVAAWLLGGAMRT